MNGRTAFNPDTGDKHEFPNLKERYGEDPAYYLTSNRHFAEARISGIRYPGVLVAFLAAERTITDGNPRDEVLRFLNERSIELTGEPIVEPDDELAEPETPDTTTDPIPATDGGQTLTADDVHPDAAGIEAGEVLVFERDATTEYVFPAKPSAETPYLMRVFTDEDDERTSEPMGLTRDDLGRRPITTTDPQPVETIDVRPPELAASNGGDSA